MAGPCDWTVSYVECGDAEVPPSIERLTPEQRARIEDMAVEFLWNWTGRKFGLCEVTVRPCRPGCPRPATFYGNGGLMGGRRVAPIGPMSFWLDYSCGCVSKCHCGTGPATVRLPGPVGSKPVVTMDGAVLDPSTYRVDNYSLLVRTDGNIWPTCQHMDADLTEPGTWGVTYDYGVAVPTGGQVAAGILAAEMALALCNDSACKLPERVQTVTRQGVTVAMIDSMEGIDQGRTGLWLVDSWVSSVRAPQPRSSVHSPDLPRPRNRVTTWT